MAHVLIMPRQGNTVESCILTEWKVKEGDSVDADSVVCMVETDKATFEVPAGETGTVLKLLRADWEDVPVLEPIAVIGKPGEDWAAALGSAGAGAPAAASAETAAGTNMAASVSTAAPDGVVQGKVPTESGGAISPRARHLADKEGLPTGGLPGSGPGGRIIERDVRAALQNRPALTAAAKAQAAGGTVPATGSGLGGRVTANDIAAAGSSTVDAAGSAGAGTAAIPGVALANLGEGAVTETAIKGIRKLISDRMHQSLAESAQLTLNGSAPAVRLQ